MYSHYHYHLTTTIGFINYHWAKLECTSLLYTSTTNTILWTTFHPSKLKNVTFKPVGSNNGDRGACSSTYFGSCYALCRQQPICYSTHELPPSSSTYSQRLGYFYNSVIFPTSMQLLSLYGTPNEMSSMLLPTSILSCQYTTPNEYVTVTIRKICTLPLQSKRSVCYS